jgi:hypothetical protein
VVSRMVVVARLPRPSQKGGKRAYEDRRVKDRSPRQSPAFHCEHEHRLHRPEQTFRISWGDRQRSAPHWTEFTARRPFPDASSASGRYRTTPLEKKRKTSIPTDQLAVVDHGLGECCRIKVGECVFERTDLVSNTSPGSPSDRPKPHQPLARLVSPGDSASSGRPVLCEVACCRYRIRNIVALGRRRFST